MEKVNINVKLLLLCHKSQVYILSAIYVLPQSIKDQMWIVIAGAAVLFRDEQDVLLLEKYIHKAFRCLGTGASEHLVVNLA